MRTVTGTGLRAAMGKMGNSMTTHAKAIRQIRRIELDIAAEDLDRRLVETVARLERVRSKALHAVESLLATS